MLAFVTIGRCISVGYWKAAVHKRWLIKLCASSAVACNRCVQ